MAPDKTSRNFKLLERKEAFWFRWLVLDAICLGIALIVINWIRVTH